MRSAWGDASVQVTHGHGHERGCLGEGRGEKPWKGSMGFTNLVEV